MGQIQITVSLIMIGLFSVAIIAFAINFAADNNAAVDISDDPEFSSFYTQERGNLSGFSSSSESQYQSIIETTIEPGSQTAQSTGAFAITPLNALFVVKNIMEIGYIKIFGDGDGFGIFLTAFVGVIAFMIGLFLYKTLKGLPD